MTDGSLQQNIHEADGMSAQERYLRKLAASKEPLEICLTNDYAFRKIFKNKKVLKGFLMALLCLDEEEIVDLEVTDPYEEGEGEEEKEGILDIKVHLNNNTRLNLEMQNRMQEDWTERSLFYNCRMYTADFKQGMEYSKLEPCIHVGILDFNLMESKGFHHYIILQDTKTGEMYSSKFVFHVIELKKLEETPEAERGELHRWARFIAAKSWEAIDMEAKGNPYREEAREEMKKINQDEVERWLYLRREMAVSDKVSQIASAERRGKRQGRSEGSLLHLISLIQTKYWKGKSLETIADEVEEDIEDIRGIYELICRNPKEAEEKIFDLLTAEESQN